MGTVVELDARSLPAGRVAALLRRRYSLEDYVERVRPVVRDVAARGYEAVKRYSLAYDGVAYDDPLVPDELADEALSAVGEEVVRALKVAASRVRAFQESLMPRGGPVAWRPVGAVAAYVPAGARPYPSTAIMTVVPARVAGVRRVVVATPPRRGRWMVEPSVLAAARVAGADAVYAVGGAQAVAGLAYGASPLPRVDMIVGPGSPYVEAAKLLVSHLVGVDAPAGPSELAAVAGCDADPLEVAYDLLAQAEHGPLSLSALLTPCERLLAAVRRVVRRYAGAEHMGAIYLVRVGSLDQAVEVVNALAPEHVELLGEAEALAHQVETAGAVAVGVPAAYLDYAAGPSHVLPTGGAARWASGLSVYTFLRPVPVVREVDEEALRASLVLARLEGFELHAASLELRVGGRVQHAGEA